MKTNALQIKSTLSTILIILLLSVTGMMKANPVDIGLAREIGTKFVHANISNRVVATEDLRLVSVYSIPDGRAAFYVFNIDHGFVMVSADDCAQPILAYSVETEFDIDNVPIQMTTYLNGFVKQLKFGIERNVSAEPNVIAQWESVERTGYLVEGQRTGRSVSPLLNDVWGQGCYYNNKCPNDSDGPCGHAACGCVAVAMSQIMNYWGYPENGRGVHSYTPDGYPTQSVDYGSTTYEWNNMPTRLTANSSSSQINAVSTLMWHCGVAVDMQYSSLSSWAYFDDVVYALTNYFGYSQRMYSDMKSNNATWLNRLKSCLNQNRPVFYGAQDDYDQGGHAFVCDGYDSNDFLHFNWGWNGQGNGYFALDALNVLGDYYFNTDNFAIFDITTAESYTISAVASPNNGGTVSGAGTYEYGSNCTLRATSNTGYTFTKWTKNGSQVSTNATYSFTVTENASYVAVFNPNSYTVSASANPSAGGTVSGGGSYNYGSNCTLTATPAAGYSFVRWTKNGSQVSTNASYSFTVTENATYVAVFSLNSYTVSASANPSAGGTVSGGGSYNYGSNCTLTATANTDYTFTNWTENGEVVSTEATYSFAVTGDRDLVANFQFHGDYIIFADPNVKAICVVNWDTNGDGELSYDEAAAVTDIGWVFYYNQTITSFEELRYFTGLTSINEAAFYGCTNMTGNLYIPNSVTAIGTYAFGDCTSLTGDLIIPNSVTTIGVGAFCNCNGFTGSLIISNSINSIEDNVFYGCSGFTGDLVIPNSVASIGSYAFGGCSGFTGGLTIPNSVTTIGEGAFGYCNGFTSSLVIPNSVVSIGDAAFENCSGFTGPLIIPNSVSSIGYYAFDDCSGFTGDLVIPNSVTMIGVGAFFNCNGFTGSLIISNSVNSIEDYVFYGCSGFTGDLVIPNSVASIGNYAFRGCSGFTGGLTIPNSVTTIGEGAFNNCNGFTGSLTISNSVTSIEGYTFSGCWGFTGSLTIPNSVTTIGERAFYNCCGLTSMTIGAEIPPTLDQDVFSCVPETIPVYIPCGSLEAYQTLEGWNEFTNYQYLDCSYHFITAGNWSEVSSWSKGTLPGVDHEVFIEAPCQLDQDATVFALTVSDGQSLTLQSGKTLTVTNALTNTSTTGLVIEDGAQLKHASENVSATVKKNIAGYGTNNGKFRLISNPLASTINPELASIYHLTRGNYDLYDWLASTPDNLEWRNFKDNSYLMSPEGCGYLYANQNGVELIFPGTIKPSQNRFTKSVNYDSGDTEHPGWNLIGNPFVCNAYLVNENNEPLPFYRMNAAGDGFEAVTPGTAIAPMEGVFYQASGNETVYFIRAN